MSAIYLIHYFKACGFMKFLLKKFRFTLPYVYSEGYICDGENLLNLSAKPYKGFRNTCYTFIYSLPLVASRAKRRI